MPMCGLVQEGAVRVYLYQNPPPPYMGHHEDVLELGHQRHFAGMHVSDYIVFFLGVTGSYVAGRSSLIERKPTLSGRTIWGLSSCV